MPAPAPPRIYSSSPGHRPHHDPSFLHTLYDNNSIHHSFNPQNMFSYPPHHTNMSQWHLYPANPYPSPPPPPPIAHKVWILDCRSCGTFLTNRGMKAVLLLRPNVSLYSSDALPVNCSAYTTNPDVLRPRAPACRPSSSTHVPLRTCECLTQTLCCHGCGATIGYMIVIPCTRCTSSITATNRATNGHRFVFHSSEVAGTERHYIADEPGVIPHELPVIMTHPAAPTPQPFFHTSAYVGHRDSPRYSRDHSHIRSQSTSPAAPSDYLPTPPLELADPSFALPNQAISGSFPFPRGINSESQHPPHAPRPLARLDHSQLHPRHPHRNSPPISVPSQSSTHLNSRPASPASSQSSDSSPHFIPNSSFPFGMPSEEKEPHPRMLKAGDILFWHHLARNGEIPGVAEDERARGKSWGATGGKVASRVVFNR